MTLNSINKSDRTKNFRIVEQITFKLIRRSEELFLTSI